MGVALLELGRPREAFSCYRRALRADAHDVGARFNAGELLLAMGRLRYISPISPYISPISPYSISRISQDAMARYADTVQVCVLVEG